MAWFKVDDKLHASRKLLKIPRRHRLAALGLWTLAGSWCADQETDGVVPDYMIEEWGGTSLLVKQLVAVGLWVQLDHNSNATGSQLECNSGATQSQLDYNWQFHNWGEYQPTKAQLQADRKKNAEKLRKWRDRNRDVTEGVTGLQNGSNHERNGAPDPARPDPARPPSISNDIEGGEAAPPSKNCRKHPSWVHDENCHICGADRKDFEAWEAAEAARPKPAREHVHRWILGACNTCEAREEDAA